MPKFFKKSKNFLFLFPIIAIPLLFVSCLKNYERTTNDEVGFDGISDNFSTVDLELLSIKDDKKPDKIYAIDKISNQKIEITTSVHALAFDRVNNNGEQIGALRYFETQKYKKLHKIYSEKAAIEKDDEQNWYIQSDIEANLVDKFNKESQKRYEKISQKQLDYPSYAGETSFIIADKLEEDFRNFANLNSIEIKTIVNRKTRKTFYVLDVENDFWKMVYVNSTISQNQAKSTILVGQSEPLKILLGDIRNAKVKDIDISEYWSGILFYELNQNSLATLKTKGMNYANSNIRLYENSYTEKKNREDDLLLSSEDTITLQNIKNNNPVSDKNYYAILLKDSVSSLIDTDSFQSITIKGINYKIYEINNPKYKVTFTFEK